MNIVLLSGGSGKRLWPLSNDVRSKQFIKIFRKADGGYESMVQNVYRRLRRLDKNADITIATSKAQVSAIRNQIGDGVSVSVEPCRRDTFPAIALAAAFLRDVKGLSPDEAVVVCPVDLYAQDSYFESLKGLYEMASKQAANIVLMGIEPTYPSEKYGYILPKTTGPVSPILTFKEKPDAATAERYIAKGALWNAGIFAFRLGYMLQKARELLGSAEYRKLFSRYASLPKISFDYAVVEKESNLAVMRYGGEWKDLGTWSTLTEEMSGSTLGKVICGERCENLHVVNELDVPILCLGLKNLIVSASPEGILVTDKEQSSYIKPLVDGIEQQVMFAEKSWGNFRVIDVETESMTVKVTLNAGHRMNYHSHDHRDEVWTVVSGTGKIILDDEERQVHPGDVVSIPAGSRHTVIADTTLQMIEVQIGKDIDVHDKHKFRLERSVTLAEH